jgi:hypothetical protein
LQWAQNQVEAGHYLHTPVDRRCSPYAYIVEVDDVARGCLIFGRPEATRCYQGKLTYGSIQDVKNGRAEFDRWEILNLARVWLDPIIQKGGSQYVHHAASKAIKMALSMIGYDYLFDHPPVDCDYPYQIRCILSYCDTSRHSGWIYLASRFKLARTNEEGIQTYMKRLPALNSEQDEQIRKFSTQAERSKRIRMSRRVESLQLEIEGL